MVLSGSTLEVWRRPLPSSAHQSCDSREHGIRTLDAELLGSWILIGQPQRTQASPMFAMMELPNAVRIGGPMNADFHRIETQANLRHPGAEFGGIWGFSQLFILGSLGTADATPPS